MSWKFNPPPGWPAQPPGWQPPPGWAPDPSWPPPPPGWQFWLPATEEAPPGPAAGTPAAGGPAAGSPVAGSPAAAGSPVAPASPPAPEPAPAPASPPAGGGTVHEAPTTVGYPIMNPPPPGSGPTVGPTPTVGQVPTVGSVPPAGSAPPGSYPGSPALPAYQPGSPGGGYPAGYPQPTPGAARPWPQRGWAMALAFTAVLLIGCLLGSLIAFVTDSDPSASPTTPPPSPAPPATTAGPPTTGPTQAPGGDALGVGEERTGQGPAIVPLELASGSFHILTVTYEGTGAFVSNLVDGNQEYAAELASSFGASYTGTHVVELGAFTSVAAVDIQQSEGDWSLLLQPLDEAEVWPDVTEGTGNTVLRLEPGTDLPAAATGTHDGESNFIVWAYDGEQYGNYLLFNEIGEGSWETEMPANTIAFSVRADGDWTISTE
jgi:hypothetical protein